MREGRDVGSGEHAVDSARDDRRNVPHRSLIRHAGARETAGIGRAPGWGEILAAAIAVGVVSGLLELAVLFIQLRVLHFVDYTMLMISGQAAWMIPSTETVLIVVVAFVLISPVQMLAAWRVRARREGNEPGPAWDWAGSVLGSLLLFGPLLAIRGFHPIAPLALSVGVGFRMRRLIVRPTAFWRRRVHGAALCGMGVLALLVLTQWRADASVPVRPATRPTGQAPNLIWIVLDTLRADRMSVYGYERPTTPALEKWARMAITFDMARSTAPWTLPSHISMFTGLWPSEHGACVDRAYHRSAPTIAEHLRSQGYATAGIVANVRMCNPAYGVSRGFDHYADYPWRNEVSLKMAVYNSSLGPMLISVAKKLGFHPPSYYPYDFRVPATVIAAKARRWLDSAGTSRGGDEADPRAPFFLFLNFMDVHGPYLPPADAPKRFWHGPPLGKNDARAEEGWLAVQARDAADAGHRPQRQKEVDAISRRLSDLYDECIAGLDAHLGQFLSELRDAGMLANTWVVITADHGEQFGEHGQFGHGSTLYNESTHVPLMLIPPLGDGQPGRDAHAGLRGRRIGVPVSLRDLPATMSDLLLPASVNPFPGRSLARHWHSDHPARPDPVLSQVDEPRLKGEDFRTEEISWMESIIDEDHVLIEYSQRPTELFALFQDPKQEHNLADRPDQAPRRQRLRTRLDGLHHRDRGGSAPDGIKTGDLPPARSIAGGSSRSRTASDR